MSQTSDRALGDIRNFFKSLGYSHEIDFEQGAKDGFRLKVKLAVRGTIGNPHIGLFRPRSHDVIDMCECTAHHSSIKEFLIDFKAALKSSLVQPYDEKTLQGEIRYIQVMTNDLSELGVVLVIQTYSPAIEKLVALMKKRADVKSLWLNYQTGSTNTIFSSNWQCLSELRFLSHAVLGNRWVFHPGSFCQNNLTFFQKIIEDASCHLGHYDKALDLYSGVGLIGLNLVKHAKFWGFAESNSLAGLPFLENVKTAHLENYDFFAGDAKEYLRHHLDADAVIVDPPRKGLEKQIKPLLGQLKKGAKVVYISCGYQSLVRDVKELVLLGFEVEFVKAYDCFAGSQEVEILCVLQKRFD